MSLWQTINDNNKSGSQLSYLIMTGKETSKNRKIFCRPTHDLSQLIRQILQDYTIELMNINPKQIYISWRIWLGGYKRNISIVFFFTQLHIIGRGNDLDLVTKGTKSFISPPSKLQYHTNKINMMFLTMSSEMSSPFPRFLMCFELSIHAIWLFTTHWTLLTISLYYIVEAFQTEVWINKDFLTWLLIGWQHWLPANQKPCLEILVS